MDDDHRHRGDLSHDIDTLMRVNLERRRVLRWSLGAGVLPLIGCGSNSPGAGGGAGSGGASAAGTGGASGTNGSCARIPEETAGPFPGDGSNGPNVLNLSGIVRGDIRSSFGALSGTAGGVPLTVTLDLVASGASCANLAGYAVYIWHCDREGRYSLYSAGATDQNYLRGVQQAGADGTLSFTTVFPGCYAGRWPHIHFEIYKSLADAAAVGNKVATSQLALPQAACTDVYATAGYEASVGNLAMLSLATDMVFSDGATAQLPAMTGDATTGYIATLRVPVPG
ncbi:MAG TPA: dioxygenase [Polyangia bacterium]|nr:dioxygenase [Polyangia bacterium]